MTFGIRIVALSAALLTTPFLLAIAFGAIQLPNVSDPAEPLGAWVHLAVPVCVFLETSILVGFVIHGELVLMVSGVAAARGDALLLVLIALAWAGAVAGDTAGLLLGRSLGRPFIDRHGHRVGLGAKGLARVDAFFARHGRKALFLGRFTGFLRSTMPFVVGSTGMTLRRLLPISAASALVWTATYTVIGYAVAESFAAAGQNVTRITSAAIVVAIAGFVIHARVSR